MSLYEQLGGEAGVAVVVDDFYARIVADELLAPWFVHADHDSIRFHLKAYLAVALGGPEQYSGRSMRQAHGGLRITGEAFDTVLDRLVESLVAAGVDDAATAKVRSLVATLRPVVVLVPRGL